MRLAWLAAVLVVSVGACGSGGDEDGGATDVAVRPDGAAELRVGVDGESVQNPCFSPTGDELAFTVFTQGYNNGPAGVYRAGFENGDEPLGAAEVILFEDDQDAVNLPGACWDEGRLALSSDRSDETHAWVIDPDDPGSLEQVDRAGGPPTAWEPSLAPDQERLVIEGHKEEDGSDPGDLYLVDLEDGVTTGLLVTEGYDDRQPNWSPEGDAILFQRRSVDGDSWDLWTVDPDVDVVDVQDSMVRLTDIGEATDGSWSPTGGAVVFSAPGDDGGAHLWVLDISAGSTEQLTTAPARTDGAASWSPDGRWILFESYPIGSGEDGEATGPASLWAIPAPELDP